MKNIFDSSTVKLCNQFTLKGVLILSLLYICNMPMLTNDYQHTLDFSSRTSQSNYFDGKYIYRIESNFPTDTERSEIVVALTLTQLMNSDYVYFDTVGGKRCYYFITNKVYKTETHTTLYLELDVFQTYQFDFTMTDSFIERSHVDRWDENGNVVKSATTEPLEFGEYVLDSEEQIYQLKDNYILTSSTPLGELKTGGYTPPITDEGGTGSTGGNWHEGKPSADGYRFLKGYEGFGKVWYYDSVNIRTIGYGVAEHAQKELFDELVSEQPITEERASRVSYDLKVSDYGKPIVERCKELGITSQQQFDALVSLAFNSGIGSITLDNDLTNAIKANPTDENTIRPIWENYKTNGGTAGLVARRKAECDIYFDNKYEKRQIVTIGQDGNYDGVVTANNGNGWLP